MISTSMKYGHFCGFLPSHPLKSLADSELSNRIFGHGSAFCTVEIQHCMEKGAERNSGPFVKRWGVYMP